MMRLQSNKGFALVLTLVITALMVAVVVELVHHVYVDSSLNHSFKDGQQASILAESGALATGQLLKKGLENQASSSLTDKWALPFSINDETGSLTITVLEESAKFNLNALVTPNGELDPFTADCLKRLGKQLKIPDENWMALADWIDSNDQPRIGGAESAYYQTLTPPYTAHNGMLSTFAELSLVKGFTPSMLVLLGQFTTIYSGAGQTQQININTASKEVLMALDSQIDSRLADNIIEKRRLKPFANSSELGSIHGMEALSQSLQGHIVVKGTLFRVISIGTVKDTSRTVEALFFIADTSKIVSWQEY